MKIIALFLILFLANPVGLYTQDFRPIFLGNDYLHYENALFKVDSIDVMQREILGDMINSFDKAQLRHPKFILHKTLESATSVIAIQNDILYPTSLDHTSYDSIKNNIYIVEGFHENYKPIFILRDSFTNQKVYFTYDPLNNYNFPFIVKFGIEEQEIIKSKIERNVDNITNEITIKSPHINSDNSKNDIVFYKIIKGMNVSYYLELKAFGYEPHVMKKGAIIMFDDGSKISKPNAEIETSVHSEGSIPYEYSTYFKLTLSDIEQLKNKAIKQYKLYVEDRFVLNLAESDLIKSYVNYVIEKD